MKKTRARNDLKVKPLEKPNPPACPKCGETYAMVKHKDGKWVCHKTHDL